MKMMMYGNVIVLVDRWYMCYWLLVAWVKWIKIMWGWVISKGNVYIQGPCMIWCGVDVWDISRGWINEYVCGQWYLRCESIFIILLFQYVYIYIHIYLFYSIDWLITQSLIFCVNHKTYVISSRYLCAPRAVLYVLMRMHLQVSILDT